MSIYKLKKGSPRRADLKGRGVVQLDNLSDELAIELAKEGLSYIQLTSEGRKLLKPAAAPIEVKKIPAKPAKPSANQVGDKK